MEFVDKIKENLKSATGKLKLDNEKGELVDESSYEFSPSFIYHRGEYSTIVQLYAESSVSRDMTFIDFLDLIPATPRKGVKIYLCEKDGVIKDEERNTLIKKNATQGAKAIKAEYKEDDGNGKPKTKIEEALTPKKTQADVERDSRDIDNYTAYESLINTTDSIVYYQFFLVITSNSRSEIDEQIEDLNTLLKSRYNGIKWDSTAGDQKERFVRIFTPLIKEPFVDTATCRNYAGINLAASPALCDPYGVAIGDDSFSLVNSAAIFDFEGSTQAESYIVIPKSERMGLYAARTEKPFSSSSIVAQAAANDICMAGHKAIHFVFNGFNYLDPAMHTMEQLPDGLVNWFDVSKVTINPLEGFGKLSDVSNLFSLHRDKLLNIFDLLNNYQFERSGEFGFKLRAQVDDAIMRFYLNNKYWTADAGIHPERTNFLNLKHPEAYATMGNLIQSFTSLEDEARRKGSTNQAEIAHALHSTLDSALTAHRAIFGSTTKISPSNALNTYYDFSKIVDENVKQAQFLNVLNYALSTVDTDDLIVIHGVDNLHKYVINKMAYGLIKRAEDNGIRFIFTFDAVKSPTTSVDFEGANHADVFAMQSTYYTNFAADPSWTMMGALMPEEVDDYARIFGSTTKISPSNALNTYYDFSKIVDENVKQAQFLNVLNYALSTVDTDDLIVIHGVDNLHKYVINKMAYGLIKRAEDNGIRFIFTFDAVKSPTTSVDFEGANHADVFAMQSTYYTNFAADPSWTMMGALMPEEVDDYARILGTEGLSQVIVSGLTQHGACQVLLHRERGQVNNFVKLSTLI